MPLLRRILGSLIAMVLLALPWSAVPEDTPQPKSIRMTCDTCPEGYAKTGVTLETVKPYICEEGDHMVVQCVPIGAMNLLAVCGSCPTGYRQIGSSSVPARCGSADGGLLSQCQLEQPENTLPDPNRGGVFCPPNCAGEMPTPGQGTLKQPKKFPDLPKESK